MPRLGHTFFHRTASPARRAPRRACARTPAPRRPGAVVPRGVEPLEVRTLFAANLLDPAFGGGDGVATADLRGLADVANDVAVLANGNILLAGYADRRHGDATDADFALTRLRPDGSPDTTFGAGGKVTTDFHNHDDIAEAMAPLPGGKILLVGHAVRGTGAAAEQNVALARYNADGSLDTTFDRDGKLVLDVALDDAAAAVAILPDGDYLVAGTTASAGGDGAAGARDVLVARFNPDGSRDRSFGGGDGVVVTDLGDDDNLTNDSGRALALARGGRFVVGGASNGDFVLLRYNADGTLDTSFGVDGVAARDHGNTDSAEALAVLVDGDILVAGSTGYEDNPSGPFQGFVARYDADGTHDNIFGGGDGVEAFGPDRTGPRRDLALLPGGKFLVTGAGVARFNPDGSVDDSFDGEDGVFDAMPLDARALALQSGRPVVAGATGSAQDPSADFAVARLKDAAPPADNNDQISEAVAAAVGRSPTGDVRPGTDVDVFAFRAAAGQFVAFDLDRRSGSSLDSLLRVFDAAGSELAASDDAPAPGESSGTDESYLRHFFATAGTYYVAVSASPNGNYDPRTGRNDVEGRGGAYRLNITNVAIPADADDQVSESRALGVGQTRSHSVENEFDVDLFRFVAAVGQELGIDVDRAGVNGPNPMLRLFDAEGNELAANDDAPAPGEQGTAEPYLHHAFTAAGTYYVGVSGSGNAAYNPVTGTGDAAATGGTGGYTLSLVDVPVDPDDQVGEARPLARGATLADSVASRNDVDLYRFESAPGAPVEIDVDRPAGSTLVPRLRIFSEDGTELAADQGTPAPGEVGESEAYLQFAPEAPGTFFVGVSDYGNTVYNPLTGQEDASNGTKGAYTIRLGTPPADPDDQISEAAPVAPGAAVQGSIDPAGDVDVYAVAADRFDRFTFDIDLPDGSGLDSFVVVFNAEGEALQVSNDRPAPGEAPGQASYIDHVFAEAGTYYVAVSSADNTDYNPLTGLHDRGGGSGAYTLVVTRVPDVPDPDDQLAEATRVAPTRDGTAVDGALDGETDVDMFSVAAAAGQTVAFDVDGTGLPDGVLRLFNAAGEEIASNDDWDGFDPFIEFTFEEAGTYYVAVSGFANFGYDPVSGRGDVGGMTGAYRLTVFDVRTPTPPPADPDDQIAEAAPLAAGQTRGGELSHPADVDMYRFVAAAGREVIFQLDQPDVDAWLRLFDADGEPLGESDGDLRFVFPAAGTYFVGVSSYPNGSYDPITGDDDTADGGTGRYALTAREVPPDADDQMSEAPTVATRSSRTGSAEHPTDVDVYAFRVSAGQRVGFDVDLPDGSALDSHLRLFNARGEELAASDDTPAPGEAEGGESYIEYVFASGGTYYVAVSGAGNTAYDVATGGNDEPGSTGQYTLILS